MLGLIGVEWRFSSRVSSGVPAACVVLRAFTCLSMKPLDLGYRGYNVMWSLYCFGMNLARSSDNKESLLSGKMYLGGLYWEMRSCNFCHMELAVLDEALYMKGYLLKVSWMSMYSFP